MKLIYITGNSLKYEISKRQLKKYQDNRELLMIDIEQSFLKLDEIQDFDVVRIATNLAQKGYELLNENVIVTDVGFYISELSGFPGPFVKYINQTLSPEDFIKLMDGKENRTAEVKECLVLVNKDGEVSKYITSFEGTIAIEVSKKDGTTMERIFVPRGSECPLAEWCKEKQTEYWLSKSNWIEFFDEIKLQEGMAAK